MNNNTHRYLLIVIALVCGQFSEAAFCHVANKPSRSDATPKKVVNSDDAEGVIACVERFTQALRNADTDSVKLLLDTDALILESGGLEKSAEEYLSEHAIGDIVFLQGAELQIHHRSVQVSGDLAWVATASTLEKPNAAVPLKLEATETMVLRRKNNAWKIVHIHWSSRKAIE